MAGDTRPPSPRLPKLMQLCKAEQARSQSAGPKLHQQWRRTLRALKAKSLAANVAILSQDYERAVDRADALIQEVDEELGEAEVQHSQAVTGHFGAMAAALAVHASRLQALKKDFSARLKALEEEREAERGEAAGRHGRARRDALTVLSALEAQHGAAEAEARLEAQSAREEARNHAAEEYNVLKLSLEAQIAELEKTFEASHETYLHNTDAKSVAFKELSRLDGEAAAAFEARAAVGKQLAEALAGARAHAASAAREWAGRNRALAAERAGLARHHRALKAALRATRGRQAERLRALATVCAGAEAELSQKLALAERILALATRCRAFESAPERVTPFELLAAGGIGGGAPGGGGGAGDPLGGEPLAREQPLGEGPPEPGALKAAALLRPQGMAAVAPTPQPAGRWGGGHAQDARGRAVPEEEYLYGFFARYNKVLLSGACAARARDGLRQENARLQAALQHVLQGLTVAPGAVGGPAGSLVTVQPWRLERAPDRQPPK